MSELEAGRELDALVAEKVMGCQLRRSPTGPSCECANLNWPHANHGTGETVNTCAGLRFYSTDIAAAWEVVKRVVETCGWNDGFQLSNGWLGEECENLCGPDEGWIASFNNGYGNTTAAPGKTVALAICRAALKAVNA